MSKDIKKALEHCVEWNCVDCPNREELGSGETVCRGRLLTDVLEYLSDLQAKLAEKDELLKQKIGDMKSTDFIKMCISCGFMVEAKENDNQTAIKELEKVKKFLLEKIAEKQSCFDNGNYNDFADGVKTICEIMLISIDNQIKSLKG